MNNLMIENIGGIQPDAAKLEVKEDVAETWDRISDAYLNLPISGNRPADEIEESRRRDLGIVAGFYGLGEEPKTKVVLAELYGVSRPMINQIDKKFTEKRIPVIKQLIDNDESAIQLLSRIEEERGKRVRKYQSNAGRVAVKDTQKAKSFAKKPETDLSNEPKTLNLMGQQPSGESERDRDVPNDLLDLYFAELGKVRLLTAEGEVELAKEIETGVQAEEELKNNPDLSDRQREELSKTAAKGQKAFDHFVAANLRLVVSIAAKFSKKSTLNLDELVQEGNIGLLRAVEKFDWRRGYKFSTYATWWIRQAIQRGVAGSERTIRLPVALHDALIKVRAASSRLESETGREPTVEELAKATNLNVDKVVKAMESDHGVTSLDQPLNSNEDSGSLGEIVAVADDDPGEEVVSQRFIDQIYDTAADVLSERSWYVLQRRYGLHDTEQMTLDALGIELGLSRESVRKIEKAALKTLQDKLGNPNTENAA